MTTPNDRSDESLEIREYLAVILRAIRAVDAKVDAVDAKVDANRESIESINGQLAVINAQIAEDRKLIQSINTRMTGLEVRMTGLEVRMTDLEGKFEGVRNDLAMVKGGHARNAMLRNLNRIADEFGFQFIAEMPQQAVIEFAKVAASKGVGQGDAESFRNADMVVHVRDNEGSPSYLAIEASYTVDGGDVRRANRNAEYLRRYTGLPAYGAIAGVEVLPDVRSEIDGGKILFYPIRPRELQSE